MVSTFHGLETARRGMTTQQSALYTTGHNIANANTPGYTRQRDKIDTLSCVSRCICVLYTTGHNLANANTPGYTRQRVNFVQSNPFPSPGLNAERMPGQLGTGVEAGTIQRIR